MEKEILQRGILYLTATERSFIIGLAQKEGASLNSCRYKPCLFTKPFNASGNRLALHYDIMLLEWSSDHGKSKFILLEPSSHYQIINWIEARAREAGIKRNLHFLKVVNEDSKKPNIKVTYNSKLSFPMNIKRELLVQS